MSVLHWRRFTFCSLAVGLVLSLVSASIAFWSIRHNVQSQLRQSIPQALSDALRYSLADEQVKHLVADQLTRDLTGLRVRGRIPLIQRCQIYLRQLDDRFPLDSGPAFSIIPDIHIPWFRGEQAEQAVFRLNCQLHYPRWLGSNLTLAMLVVLAWHLLPAAFNGSQQGHYRLLRSHGIQPPDARNLVLFHDTLDDQAKRWFDLALTRMAPAKPQASRALTRHLKAVAGAMPGIHFIHDEHTVCIHGLSIPLPKTPYFYYAWYAQQRQHGSQDGWVLNPAAERPDPAQATPLIALMERYGGHQKAINELREHGLRNKLLDQNRNKIKDELVAVLGEELASDYLFQTERDARTGRYRYRLSCSPGEIETLAEQA